MRAPSDVIAAIATAPGRAGIGVVRVSGLKLDQVAKQLFGRIPEPRVATRTTFFDATGRPIDDGIALYFQAPSSYTGEDVLELQGHGGIVVQHMLLRRCVELGARIAEPGEFTRRAFLNDKIDLAQAEAVVDIIDASTEAAARCALRSLRGEFSLVIDKLVHQLVDLRALVEATLDFPEEEIDVGDRIDTRNRLAKLRAAIKLALQSGRQGSVLRGGLQVVLAGQPNVGKSSLLNRLVGEELAIVTELPGTTRDIVRQTIQIDGVPMNIIDTAGLRDTTDTVEAIGVERAREAISRADVLLFMVDARTGVTPSDEEIIASLPVKLKRVTVFNKGDLIGESAHSIKSADGGKIYLSAKTGVGIDLLRTALLEIAGWQPGGEDIFMARERHIAALERAAEALSRANLESENLELFAEELRLAQQELQIITGEFTADDLLGEIFSRFCIGK